MVEAATTVAAVAASSAIPYVLVQQISDEIVVFGSPIDARFVSVRDGSIRATLLFDSPESAARCCASVKLTTGVEEGQEHGFLIALVGDDKVLNVYRVAGAASRTLTLTKIWSYNVPKRAVKMTWETDLDSQRRLIVGDRHGDVRSFVVSIEAPVGNGLQRGTPPASEGIVNKRANLSGDQQASHNQSIVDDDDDEEEGVTLHVGHVSFLTDFVFSSFSSSLSEPQIPASYIITADRDEHIRISRWGKRRAGYIALRYLLGSAEAVGAICTVEGSTLARLQQSSDLDEGARDVCKYAMLISCDGSKLRIWSLHPDSQCGSRKDLQATWDVKEAVQAYCTVDARKERKRDRTYGKGKAPVKRNEDGTPVLADGPDHVADFTAIITRLHVFDDGKQVTLLVGLDGASALFTVPLVSLLQRTESEQPLSAMIATQVRSPIVSMDVLHRDADGGVDVWLTHDVREEVVAVGSGSAQDDIDLVSLLRWNADARTFVKATANDNAIIGLQHDTLRVRGDADMASALILYDALTLFTKQEFEKTEILEALSDGGLIKGGLANYEIPGRPASKANKQNSEWATRKRERAREVMKQRIEARLLPTPTPTSTTGASS